MSGVSQDLPVGWELSTMEALVEPGGIAYGVLKPGPEVDGGVPMLRVSDVKDGQVDTSSIYRISAEIDQEFKRTKLRGGEVVVSIQGSVGRVAIVPTELAGANISRTLAMIRLREPGVAGWVQRALEAPQAQQAMREVVGGTTRDSLNLRDLRRIQLPIPPEPQRSCLVDFLERVLSMKASASTHLHQSRRATERARRAILAAACSGRLSAGWRKGRGLEGIDGLAGWRTLTLGEVADLMAGAGFPLSRQGQRGRELPFFKVGNLADVRDDQPLATSAHTVTRAEAAELGAKVIPEGATVFAKIGMAIALNRRRLLAQPSCIDNNMMAAIPNTNLVSGRYLLRFLQTLNLMPLARATTVPAVRKSDLQLVPIPVPPLEEQHEIVRRVDRLLGLTDDLSQRIGAIARRIERSPQAVLAKAFRGELLDVATRDTRCGDSG